MRSSTVLASALAALGCALGASPALAQSREIVLRDGDHILSLGNVNRIDEQVINDNGVWFAEIVSDVSSTSNDGALLRNGFMSIREASLVSDPPGASIQTFTDLWVNAHGNVGWPLNLQDTPDGNNDDDGLFWNTVLIAREGTLINALGVDPAAEYRRFYVAKINDNDTLQLLCDIADPSISGSTERALIQYVTDGAGNLTEAIVLFKETDPIEPVILGNTIRSMGTQPHSFALNNNDDWMTYIQMNGPDATENTAVVINGSIVLRERDPSFQEGRFYNDLANKQMDMNDFRDWVVSTQLDVVDGDDGLDNSILLRNGDKFKQEGDSFPAIAPFSLIRFDAAPIYIGNSGDVFWYALDSNPDGANNQGYYRNEDVIVKEGDVINGTVVTGIRSGVYAFHASPSGRFWIGEVALQGLGDGLVVADFGLVLPIPGCNNNPGTVEKVAGSAVVGGNVTFAMDNGQAPGVTPFIYFSTRPAIMGSPCGINTNFGEVLIGLGGPRVVGRIFGTPWNGSTPSLLSLSLPPDPTLLDVEFYGQGLFWDIGGAVGAPEVFRLTNGFKMEIGAP